jgi:hypothetical protein
MRRLAVAALLCVLFVVVAHAQDPCTVTLAFPQSSITLSANACYLAYGCQPNPVGCAYRRSLVEPVTITGSGDTFDLSAVMHDTGTVEILANDASRVAVWRGEFIAVNYAVLAVDVIFGNGFD